MALLAFVLECAALAAFIGTATSLLAFGAYAVARPFASRWAPARRADLLFALAAVPALASLALVLAAAAPSLLAAAGLGSDHCTTHPHHAHLCLVHAAGLRPLLAALGAASLAVFLFRATSLARRVVESAGQLRALERLGVPRQGRFPVVSVPAGPRLCHAVGVLRRRIVISEELSRSLPEAELRAALAHEEAHLRRRDPAALLGLSVASLFSLPPVARFLQSRFHSAVEEACDAEAAAAVGDPSVVAQALVQVASLQRSASKVAALAPAFGASELERRVHLLLEARGLPVAPARALPLLFAGAALVTGLALSRAQHLHHAVETLLHQLF